MKGLKILLLISIFIPFLGCSGSKTIANQNPIKESIIKWGNYNRAFLTYVPNNINKSVKVPVVFALHGGGGTAKAMLTYTKKRFNELADQHGFIMVYPDGIEKHWNDGRGTEYIKDKAATENIDDVGFLVEIVSHLKQDYSIDEDKVFTCGISNGGFMSNRLICDRPDVFKGAGIVTATCSTSYIESCNPSASVRVVIFNGTADNLVPYNGGMVTLFRLKRGVVMGTEEYTEFWADKNNCSIKEKWVDLPDKKDDGTTVSILNYRDCDDNSKVTLYKIHGGGHAWPGGNEKPLYRLIAGKASKEINVCDEIWQFFESL